MRAFGRLNRVEWSFSCVVQERALLHAPGRSISSVCTQRAIPLLDVDEMSHFVSTLFHC